MPRFGFKLQGSVTTNGWYLTDDILESLVALNQNRFQISLDGWQSEHDIGRKLINGQGTFDRIWQNVMAAKKSDADFMVSLRLHLTPTNFASMETLCKALAMELSNDNRFSFNLQDIRPVGGEGKKNVAPMPYDQILRNVSELSGILISQGVTAKRISSNLDTGGESTGNLIGLDYDIGGAYICYASKPNSLVVRADGTIAKCTVALSSAKNKIGKIHQDGSLEIDNDQLHLWIRGLTSLNLNELACPAMGLNVF